MIGAGVFVAATAFLMLFNEIVEFFLFKTFAAALSSLFLAFPIVFVTFAFSEVLCLYFCFHGAILPDGLYEGLCSFFSFSRQHLVNSAQLFFFGFFFSLLLDNILEEQHSGLELGRLLQSEHVVFEGHQGDEFFELLEVGEEWKYTFDPSDKFFGKFFLVFKLNDQEVLETNEVKENFVAILG